MTVLCPSCNCSELLSVLCRPWTLRLHLMHARSFASVSLAPSIHAQLRFSVLCDSLKLCIDGIPQPQHKYDQTRSCNKSKSMPRPSIVGPHNVYARTPPFSARHAPEATRANARRSMRTVVEPPVKSSEIAPRASFSNSSSLLLAFYHGTANHPLKARQLSNRWGVVVGCNLPQLYHRHATTTTSPSDSAPGRAC
jgi:hypothetical protein